MKEEPRKIEELIVLSYDRQKEKNGGYFTQGLLLESFAELIGEEILKLANRHGNIKPREVKKYFGIKE